MRNHQMNENKFGTRDIRQALHFVQNIQNEISLLIFRRKVNRIENTQIIKNDRRRISQHQAFESTQALFGGSKEIIRISKLGPVIAGFKRHSVISHFSEG